MSLSHTPESPDPKPTRDGEDREDSRRELSYREPRDYARERPYDRPSYRDARNSGSSIYVGGLPTGITETELKEKFRRFGVVVTCTIPRDPHTNLSRGFGFVVMENEKQADQLVAGFTDESIRVEKSRRSGPRESTPGRYLGRDRGRDSRRDYEGGGGRYDSRSRYHDEHRYERRYERSYPSHPYEPRGYHSSRNYDYVDGAYEYDGYGPERTSERYHGHHGHYAPYRERRSPR